MLVPMVKKVNKGPRAREVERENQAASALKVHVDYGEFKVLPAVSANLAPKVTLVYLALKASWDPRDSVAHQANRDRQVNLVPSA